jgi:hypothetical protein
VLRISLTITLLLSLCASCVNISISDRYEFDTSANEALVLIENHPIIDTGETWFVPVDLNSGLPSGTALKAKRYLPQRLATEDEFLRDFDPFVSKEVSRFALFTAPPGDYAMVYLKQNDPTGPSSVCLAEGAPVYRFGVGVTNYLRVAEQPLLSEDALRTAGWSDLKRLQDIALAGSLLVGDDDIQGLINGYPGISLPPSRLTVESIVSFERSDKDEGFFGRSCVYDGDFEKVDAASISFDPKGSASKDLDYYTPWQR